MNVRKVLVRLTHDITYMNLTETRPSRSYLGKIKLLRTSRNFLEHWGPMCKQYTVAVIPRQNQTSRNFLEHRGPMCKQYTVAVIPRQNQTSKNFLKLPRTLRSYTQTVYHRGPTHGWRYRRNIAIMTAAMIMYMSYVGWLDLPHPTVKYTERKTPRVLRKASRWMFIYI